MKIELRESINENVVIFSHKCADNSIRKTVEEAVKQGVSLAGVNLSGEDLSGGKLAGADLAVADLTGAKCDESQKDIILKAIGLVFHEGNDSK